MGQISPLGAARREARCGASGKRRNAADGLIWPAAGRVFASAGLRYGPLVDTSPRRDPCLASSRENSVKLILSELILL
jgi:hypothetical protein